MNPSLAQQVASFFGALLILIAYIGQQLSWMDSRRVPYNVLNLVGSSILAYIAFHPFQVGFVLLETIWALISAYVLLRPKRI